MSSIEKGETTTTYSFKRHAWKTKDTVEERWIKRIHVYRPRIRWCSIFFCSFNNNKVKYENVSISIKALNQLEIMLMLQQNFM